MGDVPSSAATALAFLLLVAPGFIYRQLRSRRVPQSTQTAFEETSVVVIASVVFAGASLAALLLARWLWEPTFFPDLGTWLRTGHLYFNEHYEDVGLFFFAWGVLALGGAWALSAILNRGSSLSDKTAWYLAFREAEPTKANRVCVRLRSGVEYFGYVRSYTPTDEPPAEREIVLLPSVDTPIQLRNADDDDVLDIPGWDRIVILGSEIESILVQYVSRA